MSKPGVGGAAVWPAGRPRRNARPGDASFPTTTEPSVFLRGDWAPVPEGEGGWQGPLQVLEGAVPADLSGTFYRNGPNPAFDFAGKPYHPFDGDAMVHAVRFGGGAARYLNRWVRTKKLAANIRHGFAFAEFAELGSGLSGGKPSMRHLKYDKDERGEYMSPMNTSLVHHAGGLYVLNEGDKPYCIDADTLGTKGRVDWDIKHNVTAHPRVCPQTGEMFFFGYSVGGKPPWLHFGKADASGRVTRSFPIQIPHPVMMHDMVITRTRAILFDMNLRFELKTLMREMAAGKVDRGPWRHRMDMPARFGLLPRDAASGDEVRWVEVPGCSCFHFCNAWDDGGDVVIVGARQVTVTLDLEPSSRGGRGVDQGRIHVWRLDAQRGVLRSDYRVSEHMCDFPQIDNSLLGRPCRFVYASEFVRDDPFGINGVLKYDVGTRQVLSYRHPAGGVGGEAVFARRDSGGESGDDGYLVSFCSAGGQMECVVIDARTMVRACRVALPARAPLGFHALWLGDRDGFPVARKPPSRL